jgi:signal transduction histidine kinase
VGQRLDPPVAAISVTRLPATPQQRRVVIVIAVLLLLAFAIAAPFGGEKLPPFVSFNPVVQSIVFVTDLVTATFLFAEYQVTASRAFLALAIGYLYTALIVIPYTLAFPGSFTGLLNSGPQSSAWLYYFWIDGIPLGAIAYTICVIKDRKTGPRTGATRSAIIWSALLVVALVSGITWLCTNGIWLLPPMMEGDHYNYVVTEICTPLSILIAVIATALLWSLRQSILDYWLMLVMLSLILNHVIADFLGGERYSLGFYASRGFTIVTSALVLILLMQQVTQLYVRLADANMMLERERNNKLMNLQTAVAAISHEIRQPIAAMTANGGAALALLQMVPPDLEEARSALDDVVSDGYRTGDVLKGIGALFAKTGRDRDEELIDINETVREALWLSRGELNGVVTRFELASEVPTVLGNRIQLREVLLNLVHNAVEAMHNVATGGRSIVVTTGRHNADEIFVAVKDAGPGINSKRLDGIFDPFNTTKVNGMGLGLAICRAIVERHGGKLSAFSDGKNGTLFQFVLPVKMPAACNRDG